MVVGDLHYDITKEGSVTKPKIDTTQPFLFIFDLDSTLIRLETIDELAESAGVQETVKEITKKAMEGQMDFEEALRTRSMLLKGLDATNCWKKIWAKVKFNEGAEKMVEEAKSRGLTITTAIVSGGFLPIAEQVRQHISMDYAFANTLSIDPSGKFSGHLEGTIMTPAQKKLVMLQLAEKHGVPECNVFAIGDGANDIPMVTCAGVGIAYCAKQALRDKVN